MVAKRGSSVTTDVALASTVEAGVDTGPVKEKTTIVCILDRSGSMGPLTGDTIGGFNAFVEQQREQTGHATLTTVLFDDHYEVLYSYVDINHVDPLTHTEYFARGMTALFDAVGKTIAIVKAEVKADEQVICVITTDGYENASREYSQAQVKALINEMTNEHGWQFLFLGADIDAAGVAGGMGISPEWAAEYDKSAQGVEAMYRSVARNVSSYRTRGQVDADWSREMTTKE